MASARFKSFKNLFSTCFIKGEEPIHLEPTHLPGQPFLQQPALDVAHPAIPVGAASNPASIGRIINVQPVSIHPQSDAIASLLHREPDLFCPNNKPRAQYLNKNSNLSLPKQPDLRVQDATAYPVDKGINRLQIDTSAPAHHASLSDGTTTPASESLRSNTQEVARHSGLQNGDTHYRKYPHLKIDIKAIVKLSEGPTHSQTARGINPNDILSSDVAFEKYKLMFWQENNKIRAEEILQDVKRKHFAKTGRHYHYPSRSLYSPSPTDAFFEQIVPIKNLDELNDILSSPPASVPTTVPSEESSTGYALLKRMNKSNR